MKIGIPKEIKNNESRVGMTPSNVREVVSMGHQVYVETQAGMGIGIQDSDYETAGATIFSTNEEVFGVAEMIIKVKEPQPEECRLLRPHQVLFTYLHLAPDPKQAQLLRESECTAIAYETVTDARGGLPLLTPMSEVAGRMSIQVGAHCLEKAQGGRGVLLGGVPGVSAASVVILGGGVVGSNALRMAVGMEAEVTVIDRSLSRLRELNNLFGVRLKTLFATGDAIEQSILKADLIIGAVLVPGDAAPKLVTREHLDRMQPGAVLVDVSIDQGGCFETSKPTTHSNPTFKVGEIVHYCVANMPGGAARTSTFALNNATLPFISALANHGVVQACKNDPHLLAGVNVHAGHITHEAVARALKMPYLSAERALQLVQLNKVC